MKIYLNQQNSPHIKVEVLLDKKIEVDCLVDTGFSGGLALPEICLSFFSQKPAAFQEFELADGSFVIFAIYKTKVQFLNTEKEMTLVFTKSDEGIAGIEFLMGWKFVLDLKKLKVMFE